MLGHYNAHYDTTHDSARIKECCREGQDFQDCNLCRFVFARFVITRRQAFIINASARVFLRPQENILKVLSESVRGLEPGLALTSLRARLPTNLSPTRL